MKTTITLLFATCLTILIAKGASAAEAKLFTATENSKIDGTALKTFKVNLFTCQVSSLQILILF